MHRRFLSAIKTNGSSYEPDKSSSNGSTPTSLTTNSASERSDDEDEFKFYLDESPLEIPDPIDSNPNIIGDGELAELVAHYGHAPATAWLEKARYRIWRPSEPIPPSSFLPVQGYLHARQWVFAWGSPLVSDKSALKPTLMQFIAWVRSHGLRLVYCCVPEEVEELLADMGWTTVGCLCEDIIDPRHILEMTQWDDEGGHGSKVKDLKKNLRRAARADVDVEHIPRQDLSDDLEREIEDGVSAWKRTRKGHQLAATSFDPWLDFENREYWVALQHGKVIGVLILTLAGDSYVIKNAAQFPGAPKGTSELLIHTALRDLYEKGITDHYSGHPIVTFNISAADRLTSSDGNLEWLKKTYTMVAHGAHLMNRHDFRRKFDTSSQPMFVCYPSKDGFGLDGIRNLLKLLRR